jgi:hypothetical protein
VRDADYFKDCTAAKPLLVPLRIGTPRIGVFPDTGCLPDARAQFAFRRVPCSSVIARVFAGTAQPFNGVAGFLQAWGEVVRQNSRFGPGRIG